MWQLARIYGQSCGENCMSNEEKKSRLSRHIRTMHDKDRQDVLEMMRGFYASPAVQSDGSESIFGADIDECLSDSPFASGYVFINEEDDILGYAMLAHSYSTEYGRRCVWIEDLFLKEEARGCGLADEFFDYLKTRYPDCLHRLEAEKDNERALASYAKNGFVEIPYAELLRNADDKVLDA